MPQGGPGCRPSTMNPSRTFTKLDDVDRVILHLLQRDARHATAVDIAERIEVSDGTVRNRIGSLEERGVIKGYVPIVNYAEAGYQLAIKIRCTSRIVDRDQLAREALQITGVISVDEIMTGRNNVVVTAVAPTHDDLTEIAKALDELGFEVESEELLRHHYFRPCNHVGVEAISDGENGTYEI